MQCCSADEGCQALRSRHPGFARYAQPCIALGTHADLHFELALTRLIALNFLSPHHYLSFAYWSFHIDRSTHHNNLLSELSFENTRVPQRPTLYQYLRPYTHERMFYDARQLHPNYYVDLLRRTSRQLGISEFNSSTSHASRVPKIVPMASRPGSAEDLSSL